MKKTAFLITFPIVALLAIAYFIVSKSETAVQSEHVKSFDWMVQTFEQNDAGFPYYLEEKGADDYARHTASCRKKIRRVKSEQEYLFLMNEWLHYFRKNHIGVFPQNGDKLSEAEKEAKAPLYGKETLVDIRNGTGGSDYSHYNLIPYYYTQPMRILQHKLRATELNAQAYEKYTKMYNDSSYIRSTQQIVRNIRDHLGDYVDFSPGSITGINSGYTPSKYPARVAVICNQNNGSADEGFLYRARQSYKVKIFGKPTAGAFDCSNVNPIDFRSGKYILFLAMTFNKSCPEYRIDDIGMQPDYYLDDDIPYDQWVAHVQNVLETE